ncbi:MAG: T9SS type A sorting domain-containing protein, partial [Bacteroidota bacterium]
FQYTINARVHDSFDSGNGNTYTNDVLFGINDGTGWSELFDDTMDEPFVIEGGNTITFGVSSYFVGTLGSYLLEVDVQRSPSTSIDQAALEPFVTVGPNPSQRYFDLTVNLDIASPIRADIFSANGQVMGTWDFGLTNEVGHRFDLTSEAAGVYLLLLDVDGVQYRRRLVLTK